MTRIEQDGANRAAGGTSPDVVGSPRGFTLVEMIVVISIILIILALALPAAQSLWEERKASEAENTLQGLFMTARARAVQADGAQTGLFFFLDEHGVQKIVTIAWVGPLGLTDALGDPCNPPATLGTFAYDNVFEIDEEQTYVLPAPMRVVPRYVVDPEQTGQEHLAFGPEELVNDSFLASPADKSQRHRNYFAMIFNTNGQLLVDRNVLIRDVDADDRKETDPFTGSAQYHGSRTGLIVGPGPCPAGRNPATTVQYFTREGDKQFIDPAGGADPERVPSLITDENDVAINFLSVDGLLVYDDSSFSSLPDQTANEQEAKRDLLLRTAQPMYISRWTGVVIRGPLGENVAPQP